MLWLISGVSVLFFSDSIYRVNQILLLDPLSLFCAYQSLSQAPQSLSQDPQSLAQDPQSLAQPL